MHIQILQRGYFQIQVKGFTHPGRRKNNEDNYCILEFDGFNLLAVADGLGGYNAGEVASEMALGVIGDIVRELAGTIDEKKMLRIAIAKANKTITELSGETLEYEGMSTTVVAALIKSNKVFIANVGDSRAYLINDVGIKRITKDQSIVQLMLDKGKLDEEEAFRHPLKNMVLQVLGFKESVVPDLYELELKIGDILLLCSDGLSGSIRDQAIEEVIKSSDDLNSMSEGLIATALDKGGTDNITVVLCRYNL